MKKFCISLILPFILILSCETVPTQSEMEFLLDLLEVDEPISVALPPEPLPEPPPQTTAPMEEPFIADQAFDPANISEDLYETTKAEIQDIIQKLDIIIRDRNYNAWLGYLSGLLS